ncbi:hypothetical protein [Acanthopleuribacter pedis]|uniref:Uncharacterized protein n=1 Tax=Acanthopleuribacter pedis TaxID=442870 RepID=A0A8J7QIP4_9BACT|nr:hypothetical protein [Acanthopleuribacter pedis]MBO1321476.1 hypothetical protein [Acanthopleuribacter pedis]
MPWFHVRWVVGVLLVLGLAACGEPAPKPKQKNEFVPSSHIEIALTQTVRRGDVKRFGINMTGQSYWGSQQILNNVIPLNPGFEGWLFQTVVSVEIGGRGEFVTRGPASGWPEDFWKGQRFEIINGAHRGKSGRIMRSSPGKEDGGARFMLDQPLELSPNDTLILRQRHDGEGHRQWWIETEGAATVSTMIADTRPDSPGTQSLKLSAPRPGDRAILRAYADTKRAGHEPFLRLSGEYRLSFWAKRNSPETRLKVVFRRITDPQQVWLEKTITLTDSWSEQTFDFQIARDSRPGSIELVFELERGNVQFDDMQLVRTKPPVSILEDDPLPNNPTVFRDEVVSALKRLRPGILRYHVGHWGDSLDNMLADPFARKTTGYSYWSGDTDPVTYPLHHFLELCRFVDAEPWIIVPVTFSAREMQGLIDYLSGPTDSHYGRLRRQQGYREAWTRQFNKVHLELGNEAWNETFRGATIDAPDVYGRWGHELFTAARRSTSFRKEKYQLILGGQPIGGERNQRIHAASRAHDAFTLAPYTRFSLDDPGTATHFYRDLFQETRTQMSEGWMKQNYDMVAQSDHKIPLTIYETNLHTTEGDISQSALERFIPSAGSAIGMGFHMMHFLSEMGIRDQCFYNLGQYSFDRPDEKEVLLWGVVRNYGPPLQARPNFYMLEMLNAALDGNMMVTEHSGRLPDWQGVFWPKKAFQNGRLLASYGFKHKNGGGAMVVFNLDTNEPIPIRLRFPNRKKKQFPAKYYQLSYARVTDNNETERDVRIVDFEVPDFGDGYESPLGPITLNVWIWEAGE